MRPSAVLVSAAFGFLCGRAASRGAGPAWIALQCGLAAIIATGFPASLERASLRALIILAGGLTQTGCLAIARFARRRLPPPPPPNPFVPHYAVHLAIALAAAMLVERLLALRNGYWAAMTALLVLRPDRNHTGDPPSPASEGPSAARRYAVRGPSSCRTPAPWPSRWMRSPHSGRTFSEGELRAPVACVTIYVVFIFSLAGVPEEQVAMARIVWRRRWRFDCPRGAGR